MTDVVVIGGGPAGLEAARAARRKDAGVVLIDSADELGGQYWRHLPAARSAPGQGVLHHDWHRFEALRAELDADPECEILTSAQVWALEPVEGRPGRLHLLVGPPDGFDRTARALEPDAIVLATGAYDRALPFPGWDLPGVFTAGGAQALAKGDRVAVGQRVLVAGAGPFLLPVAVALVQAGSRVVAVAEASTLPSLGRGWLPRPWQLARAGKKGVELLGYVSNHLRHRIPYLTATTIVRAEGIDRVERVVTARVRADWSPIRGTEQTYEVDAVAVGHGFTPRLELAVAAECEFDDAGFVRIDEGQRTTADGVFAAGEITGIGGVDLALAEGEIAGHTAAGGAIDDPAIGGALRHRATYSSFADRIEAAHGIRAGWPGWLTPGTVVCRCEEVTAGELRDAVDELDGAELRSIKLATRAGLGICQGRVCGRTVDSLVAGWTCERAGGEAEGRAVSDPALVDRRSIAVPIRLGELARKEPDA